MAGWRAFGGIFIWLMLLTASQNLLPAQAPKTDLAFLDHDDLLNFEGAKLSAKEKKDPYFIFVQAYGHWMGGDSAKAVTFLDNQIKKRPQIVSNTFVQYVRGAIALESGDSAAAETYFLQSYESDSSKANKWVRLELFYLVLDSNETQAMRYLEEALAIHDRFIPACIAYSEMKMDVLDRPREALLWFKKRKLLKAPYYALQSYLGTIYYNDYKVDKAFEAYTFSNEIFENTDAHFGLGNLYHYDLQNLSKAKRAYLRAIELDSTNFQATLGLAWLYFDLEQNKKAKQYFRASVELMPAVDIYAEYLLFMLLADDYKEARKVCDQALEIFGENATTESYVIALDYLERPGAEKLKKAVKAYKEKYSEAEAEMMEDMFRQVGVYEEDQ